MKTTIAFLLTLFLFLGCKTEKKVDSLKKVNWEKRLVTHQDFHVFQTGETYLSVYSEIYSKTEKRTFNLTATVSLRNINSSDTVYISKADYYNTKGDLIRTYIKKPIYIAPMETIEIIIAEADKDGGTGANFFFEWTVQNDGHQPLFEAVMISPGPQGISFTTQGVNR